MKTLLLVFGLFGGLFGNGLSNNETFDQKEECDVVLTEEQEELKLYAEQLLEEYNFDEMDREEMLVAKEEIRLLVAEKALELGVELPEPSEKNHNYSKGYSYSETSESKGNRGSSRQ